MMGNNKAAARVPDKKEAKKARENIINITDLIKIRLFFWP
jgi:hypothetical protein